MNDGRTLSEAQLEIIEHHIFSGCYHDHEIIRLLETIRIQRQILAKLFRLFKAEPLRRISVAEPIANSTLAHFKELVSMDDAEINRQQDD